MTIVRDFAYLAQSLRRSMWRQSGRFHRARLIDTGQYIKTSQQTRITIVLGTPQPRTLRIGEEIGKLIKFSQEDS